MGGKALKNCYTRRCSREEFDIISNEILYILKQHMELVDIPLFLKGKESFGDIDIICYPGKSFNMVINDFINQTFSPNEIYHNGNCYSFDYKEIQIDLILATDKTFHTMKHYYSYNDLGMFIGLVAQGFGLKYGQKGLFMKYNFKNQHIGDIQTSNDFEKIYTFLGFDYKRYDEGFNGFEEIYEYVYNSKYFNHDSFMPERLNRVNYDRNIKRPSYINFLEWIKLQPRKEYVFKSKEDYFDLITNVFPDACLIENIRRIEYKYCKSLYIKSKFNGGDIMKRFGIEGKALGELIPKFKDFITYRYSEIYPKNTFEEFILDSDKDVIFDEFEFFLD